MTPGAHCSHEYILTEIQIRRILVLMYRDSVMDEDEFLKIAAELKSRPFDTRALPAAPERKPTEILTDAQLWDIAYKKGQESVQHQPPASPDALKKIEKTFSEKYDKSDQWDCGYRAGLEQCKRWLNE